MGWIVILRLLMRAANCLERNLTMLTFILANEFASYSALGTRCEIRLRGLTSSRRRATLQRVFFTRRCTRFQPPWDSKLTLSG